MVERSRSEDDLRCSRPRRRCGSGAARYRLHRPVPAQPSESIHWRVTDACGHRPRIAPGGATLGGKKLRAGWLVAERAGDHGRWHL